MLDGFLENYEIFAKMKTLICLLLALVPHFSYAAITEGELLSAISCNTKVEKQYFYAEFEKQYGKPVRVEQGSAWFKGSGTMYGSQVREVFVSVTPNWNYVGVILDTKPADILNNIRTATRYPTNVFESGTGYWVGADGRNIMWHAGKYAKLFCTASWSMY